MCVFVCISHTCRNLNFAKNVTTLLHWADDMKCLINSVKNSSSKKKKKKKKNPYRPTLFLFSPLRQYNNFLFLALDTKPDMPTSGNTNLYFEAHKPVFFNKNLYFLKTYTNRLPLPHFITRIFITSIVIHFMPHNR